VKIVPTGGGLMAGDGHHMLDPSVDEQIAQVRAALRSDLGTAARPDDLDRLAATAYERVATGARVRSFLPLLAEREARHLRQELEPLRARR
jgi:hypothetical protein